jgi:2-polyprenyl-3-methyl-5-hydroxy-6-metoxy-1,4-benzoquinol methylase
LVSDAYLSTAIPGRVDERRSRSSGERIKDADAGMWELGTGRGGESALVERFPLLKVQMYDAGWLDIVNIDARQKLIEQYSKRVIEDMKERHISREKMQWLEMDILDLQFEDESFDLVIDKGEHDYIDQS